MVEDFGDCRDGQVRWEGESGSFRWRKEYLMGQGMFVTMSSSIVLDVNSIQKQGIPYGPSFILPIVGAIRRLLGGPRPSWGRRRRRKNRRPYWGVVPPQAPVIDSHRRVKQRWHRQTLGVAPGGRWSMVHHDGRHDVTVRRKPVAVLVVLVPAMLMANDRGRQRGRFAGAIDQHQGRRRRWRGLPETRQVVACRWAD